MSKLRPNRKKLPARRLIVYLLIALFVLMMLIFWEWFTKYLAP